MSPILVVSALACALLAGNAVAAEPLLPPSQAYETPDAWRQPIAPQQLAEHTWRIGTQGINALLIKTDAGAVLIDGGLPQAADMLLAHVRALGVAPGDLKLILHSHAHGESHSHSHSHAGHHHDHD